MDKSKLLGVYKEDYNLKHLTWFKTGGNAQIFYKPYDINDLSLFLKMNANTNDFPITIIGAGSNIIIRDKGIDGIVIKLSNRFANIEVINDELHLGCGALNFNVSKFCLENNIAGYEFLVGIPGTIGGGIVMNAGSYGSSFADILLNIEAVDFYGNIINIDSKDINFSYRKSNLPTNLIVTSAKFKIKYGDYEQIKQTIHQIQIKREETQPIKSHTGGSTFMNPDGYKAWELIDKANLRGYQIGDAQMSTLHCNFMINNGNASSKDLENLGEFVRKTVYEKTGILLQWEIKRVGKDG